MERKASSTANESTAAGDGLTDTISRPATGDDDVRRRLNCGRYTAPGQNAPAVSTHEYAEAYRRWLWQYTLWTQRYLLCSVLPVATPYRNVSQGFGGVTPPAAAAAVNGSAPGNAAGQQLPAGPVRFAQRQQNEVNRPPILAGKECQVPALWKRVVAEFIDFLLLFLMKLVASVMVIDYIGVLDIEKYDIEQLLAQEWDSDAALLFTSDLIAMEIANRIFICLFETLCLRRGFAGSIGGTTPGKYLMRLRVISCQSVTQLPGNKVLVIPGNDIGFWNAFLRSVIKNFSLVFFFPVCFTVFFFPNSRTAYDIASSSVVVEVTPENLWAWPRR